MAGRSSSQAFFLFFLYFFQSCQSYQWPSDLKRCSQNEINLNKCLLDTARIIVPGLAKGNKDLGIRPLDPLRMGNMTVFSDRPPVNMSFRVINGILDGLSKIVLQKISYNTKTNEMIIEGLHKNIKMSGGFDTFGSIFFLNLKSRGNFLFENKNVQAFHMVKLLPTRKKGHVEMDLQFRVKNIGKTKMSFKDSTLPPQTNEALTKLVNDNWRIITKAVMPTFEKAIAQLFTAVLSPLFKRFPMSTLFPESL